jgi:hypothetical protein
LLKTPETHWRLTTSPKECDEIDEENGSRPPRKWVPDHAGRAIIACLRDAALRQLLRQADLTIGDQLAIGDETCQGGYL